MQIAMSLALILASKQSKTGSVARQSTFLRRIMLIEGSHS
jgi:hypothetical protein